MKKAFLIVLASFFVMTGCYEAGDDYGKPRHRYYCSPAGFQYIILEAYRMAPDFSELGFPKRCNP